MQLDWKQRLREVLGQGPVQAMPNAVSRAAVAMVIGPHGMLRMMVRAEREGDPWSGHVGFPGGREELDDRDLLATACRETREEVGWVLSEADCLGPLDPVRSPVGGRSDVVVRPFVFWVDRPLQERLNHEVAEVFSVSLATLMEGVGRGDFTLRWSEHEATLPCVRIGGRRLWGMSLRMVDDLLERLRGH